MFPEIVQVYLAHDKKLNRIRILEFIDDGYRVVLQDCVPEIPDGIYSRIAGFLSGGLFCECGLETGEEIVLKKEAFHIFLFFENFRSPGENAVINDILKNCLIVTKHIFFIYQNRILEQYAFNISQQ